MLEILA